MSNQEHYQQWVRKRREIDVGEDFADATMQRISRGQQACSADTPWDLERLFERLWTSTPGKIGLILGVAVAGSARLIVALLALS